MARNTNFTHTHTQTHVCIYVYKRRRLAKRTDMERGNQQSLETMNIIGNEIYSVYMEYPHYRRHIKEVENFRYLGTALRKQ